VYGESIVRRVIMWLPWLLLVVVTGVFLMLQQRGQQMQPVVGENQRPLVVQGGATGVVSYNAAVKVASPAVVNIYTTQKVRAHPQINDPRGAAAFSSFMGKHAAGAGKARMTPPASALACHRQSGWLYPDQ
jgi:serine protease DegS